jgi:mannosyltransferase
MLQAVLNSKPRTILIAVLLLGLFLRVYCLTCESVWLDEGYSILWAKQEPLEMIDAVSRDVHPPLYFLVLHYWIALFGDAEFTIRFLSVIFGTLAIFMMYKVGSLIFDRNVGLLSSVILALSAFHIYYSQELRAYSLMVLLTLASMYYFIRLLEERKRGIYAGYILSSTLLLYTHYFGIFVVLVQNVFFFSHHLFMKRRVKISPRKWHRLQAILFITFLPCFPFLLRQSIVIQSGAFLGWIPRPSLISVFITFLQYSGYFSYFAENIAGLYSFHSSWDRFS